MIAGSRRSGRGIVKKYRASPKRGVCPVSAVTTKGRKQPATLLAARQTSLNQGVTISRRGACALPPHGAKHPSQGTPMRTTTTTLLALFITLAGCATTVQQGESASIPPVSPPRNLEPRIELWTTGGDVVRRG